MLTIRSLEIDDILNWMIYIEDIACSPLCFGRYFRVENEGRYHAILVDALWPPPDHLQDHDLN